MNRKEYDPLGCLPSSGAVRQRLEQTEILLSRLRILLEVIEKIEKEESKKDSSSSKPKKYKGR